MTDRPIIVTRTEPGTAQTAEALKARGLNAILSPVLTLARSDAPLPALSGFGGIVFTSANGVRFTAGESEVRDLPAWCVGPATASEALREGYSPVHQSSGDATDLAHYIAHHWPAGAQKRLLHVANSAARGVLREALEAEGFEVTYVPLYHAPAAPALSADAAAVLEAGQPAIVLIHSSKGAQAFLQLCKGVDLSQVSFVAISQQAAQPVLEAGHESVIIAAHPDEAHLLETLDQFLAGR